jgi:hypothetical protein
MEEDSNKVLVYYDNGPRWEPQSEGSVELKELKRELDFLDDLKAIEQRKLELEELILKEI